MKTKQIELRTQKTKLIELLTRAPVEFRGRRLDRIAMPPLDIKEESEVETTIEYPERETYRFGANFGATFYRMPNEPSAERLPRYKVLIRSVTEGVYGEVRDEVRKLLPVLYDIDDRHLREAIESVVNNLLDMTEPD